MRSKRSRLTLIGVLALALSVTAGLSVSAEAKKGGGLKAADVEKSVNLVVPDRVAGQPYGRLDTNLSIGKKFKKKTVGEISITFQTTGLVPNAADDLQFRLTAPNGRTADLVGNLVGQSIGKLTLTPDTTTRICNTLTPPCADPQATLNPPFAGIARDIGLADVFGQKMRGTWTFTAFDDSANGQTSILNSIKLRVEPARPVD